MNLPTYLFRHPAFDLLLRFKELIGLLILCLYCIQLATTPVQISAQLTEINWNIFSKSASSKEGFLTSQQPDLSSKSPHLLQVKIWPKDLDPQQSTIKIDGVLHISELQWENGKGKIELTCKGATCIIRNFLKETPNNPLTINLLGHFSRPNVYLLHQDTELISLQAASIAEEPGSLFLLWMQENWFPILSILVASSILTGIFRRK